MNKTNFVIIEFQIGETVRVSGSLKVIKRVRVNKIGVCEYMMHGSAQWLPSFIIDSL